MTDACAPLSARRTAALALLAAACGHAAAQTLPTSCLAILDDAQRLECYDRAVGRVAPAPMPVAPAPASPACASRAKACSSRS